MKRTILIGLALLDSAHSPLRALMRGPPSRKHAKGHNVILRTPERYMQKARLGNGSAQGWSNVKIVASSDVNGYCAIAKARHPNGQDRLGIGVGHICKEAAAAAVDASHRRVAQTLKSDGHLKDKAGKLNRIICPRTNGCGG